MVDTRATQVLKWSLANKRDVALEEELKSDLTTAFVVTAITLPFALIIGSILSWYAPVITQASAEYYSLVRITCGILILGLVINKYFDLFEAVLAGMNMGYKRMGFRAIIVAFGGLLKVLVITNGLGLIGLSVVQIIVSLITGFTFLYIVKKHVPWFAFGKTNLSKVKSFGKLSGWFMAFSTLKMLLLNSDKILLGFIAGPVLVAKYALTMFTSSAVQGSMIAVITGMTPGICTLFGKGEFDKVKKARKSIITLTWLFSATIGTALLFLNKSFIGLWVGIENYAGNIENFFILIIAVQVIFFQLDGLIINATLDMKNKVLLSACASVVTIILSFLLVPHYEIIGICISIFIGRLFYSIGFPVLLKQRMNDQSRLISIRALQPFILMILLFCLATYAGKLITISGWFALLAIGAVVTIVSGLIFWFVGMRPQDRLDTVKSLSGIKLLKMKN
jgi:O-antigen/teichoic acid export membrane protein